MRLNRKFDAFFFILHSSSELARTGYLSLMLIFSSVLVLHVLLVLLLLVLLLCYLILYRKRATVLLLKLLEFSFVATAPRRLRKAAILGEKLPSEATKWLGAGCLKSLGL